MEEGEAEEEDSRVRVYLRLRPNNKLEAIRRSRRVVELVDGRTVAVDADAADGGGGGGELVVALDGVLDSDATSQRVYEGTSCREVPRQLLEGYHCTVAAYGATGTGKTRTVAGGGGGEEEEEDGDGGLIALLARGIFDALRRHADPAAEFTVRCSAIEIYLERLRDLLVETGGVRFRGDGDDGGRLAGCAMASCVSERDVINVFRRARVRRTLSSTDPNRESNRSTCLFQLQLEQRNRRTGERKVSRLRVYDLVASELASNRNGNLETTQSKQEGESSSFSEPAQVSASLQALHKLVRERCAASSSHEPQPYLQESDTTGTRHLPAVARLLGSDLTRSHTTVILTASHSHYAVRETVNTLKFGQDCRKVRQKPAVNIIDRGSGGDYDAGGESGGCGEGGQPQSLAQALDKVQKLETLAKSLAVECERLRERKPPDKALFPVIDAVRDSSAGGDGDEGRRLNFVVETRAQHEVNLERMRLRKKLRSAEQVAEEARQERDQLRSDVAVLQAQVTSVKEQQSRLQQELQTAKHDVVLQQQRKAEVEHNLRTSQFRESEAIVFLRQLRRFYFRLLQKAAVDGNGHVSEITTLAPGAPSLAQLQDVDNFMLEAGLLEKHEVGKDVSLDCRPSREALERSTAAAEEAVGRETAAAPPSIAMNGTHGSQPVPIEAAPAYPSSIVRRQESPDKIEARQKLYRTPAGRCVELREKILEEELLQMSEKCMQLTGQLEEERANVEALSQKVGLVGAFDRMKMAQESRQLKEQLARKNNDLKAVIWKMNEQHMISKTLKTQSESREQHVLYLEENLADTQRKHELNLLEQREFEKKLRDEMCSLQRQIGSVPVWQLSDTSDLAIPLGSRLVVPFSAGQTNGDVEPDKAVSVGDPGEWIDLSLVVAPPAKEAKDADTQTEEAVFAQLYAAEENQPYTEPITHENVDNLIFVDSPGKKSQRGKRSTVSIGEVNVDQLTFVESSAPAGRTVEESLPKPLSKEEDVVNSAQISSRDSDSLNKDPVVQTKPQAKTEVDVSTITKNVESSAVRSVPASAEPSISAALPKVDVSTNTTRHMEESTTRSAHVPATPSVITALPKVYVSMNTKNVNDSGTRAVPISAEPTTITHSRSFDEPTITVPRPSVDNEQLSIPLGTENGKPPLISLTVEEKHQYSADFYEEELELLSVDAPQVLSSQETVEVKQQDTADKVLESSPFLAEDNLEEEQVTAAEVSEKPPFSTNAVVNAENGEKEADRELPARATSSFMERLKNQARKKSNGDELSSLFKTIANKNADEEVIETSGAVSGRDATRTMFFEATASQVKSTPTQIDESRYDFSRNWKPRNIKNDDDDDSETDSFAEQFMRGRGTKDSSSSNGDLVSSKTLQSTAVPEQSQLDSEDDSDANESSDEESKPERPKPTSTAQTSRVGRDDSDSSEGSDENPTSPATRNAPVVTASGFVRKDSSSSEESSDDESKASPPPKPKPDAVVRKDSSSSDETSDDESRASPPRPEPAAPVQMDPSSSGESSDDESKAPPPKPNLVAPSRKDSSSSDESSDDESKAPPSKPKPAAPVRKDSSSSDESSDDESKAPPPKPKPAAPVRTDSSSSGESSSDDESKTPPTVPKPAALACKESSSSKDESSDEESEGPPPKPKPAAPARKDSNSSEGSSDEESAAPLPKTKPAAPVPKDSSSSEDYSSDEESRVPPRPKVAASVRKDSSSSHDSSEDELKASSPKPKPAAPVRKDSSSSEDENSDEESKALPPKPTPAALLRKDSSSSEGCSDDEPKAPPKPSPVAVERKESSSNEEKSSDEEESASSPTKLAAPVQNGARFSEDESSDEESSKETAIQEDSEDESSASDDSSNDADRSEVAERGKEIIDLTFTGGKAAGAEALRKVPDFSAQIQPGVAPKKEKKKKKKSAGKQDTTTPSSTAPKTRFVIKNGKLVKDEGGAMTTVAASTTLSAASTTKAQFVIQRGKLVKSISTSSLKVLPASATKKPETKFVIKDGKLVKDTGSSDDVKAETHKPHPRSKSMGFGELLEEKKTGKKKGSEKSAPTRKKATFVIQNGKLVKKEEAAANEEKSSPAESEFKVVGGGTGKNKKAKKGKTEKKKTGAKKKKAK